MLQLLSNTGFRQAAKAITNQLIELTTSYNETALSLGVRSLRGSDPILSFHHTPSMFNTSGVHQVNGDTVYRAASITKLFTTVSVLQFEDKINLSERVVHYLPELLQISTWETVPSQIDWNTVTVESFLSQLSGLPATRKATYLAVGVTS